MGAYSNRRGFADALVSAVTQLRQAQEQTSVTAFSVRSTQTSSRWRVGDRLSDADQGRLIAAFTAGTKRKLAERYGISESSVRRLIRQYGASKPLSALSRAGGLLRVAHRECVTGRAVLSGGGRIASVHLPGCSRP